MYPTMHTAPCLRHQVVCTPLCTLHTAPCLPHQVVCARPGTPTPTFVERGAANTRLKTPRVVEADYAMNRRVVTSEVRLSILQCSLPVHMCVTHTHTHTVSDVRSDAPGSRHNLDIIISEYLESTFNSTNLPKFTTLNVHDLNIS